MKRIMQVLLGLIAVIVVAFTCVVLFVSPNQFKPVLQDYAKSRGMVIEIGNMGWTFWPRLGVSLADVSLADVAHPDAPLAQFSDAGLMLAFKPLLKGNFEVDYVRLINANIALVQDINGKGNWEFLLQENNDAPAESEKTENSKPLALAVQRIYLNNAALTYRDEADKTEINLRQLTLDVTDLNTQGRQFPLKASWQLVMSDTDAATKKVLDATLSHTMAITNNFNNFQLNNGVVDVALTDKSSANFTLRYDLNLLDIQNNLSYDGKISTDNINGRHWLKLLEIDVTTADVKALSAINISSSIKGTTEKISFDNLVINLDGKRIDGKVAISDFATQAVTLTLNSAELNADDYLPPVVETEQTVETESSDTELPLDLLRDLQANVAVNVKSLQLKKMQLADVKFTLNAAKGVLRQGFSANAYQGSMILNSTTNVTAKQAALVFDTQLSGVEVASILAAQQLDKKMQLSGVVNAKAEGRTQGASVNKLIDGMDMSASFNGDEVKLSPLNVEERVCQAVQLITERRLNDAEWENFTPLKQLAGQFSWRNQQITLTNLSAGVSQILLSGSGVVDLAKSNFNISLPIKLVAAGQTAEESKCGLSTELPWLNRSLSLLRCEGSLENLNLAKDCGLDKSALADLTRDYAIYKVKEKHGDKIDAVEQKIDDQKAKLTEKITEKLGVEGDQELNAKSALSGFLKKKLGATSSAANSDSATESESETPTE